MAAVRYGILLVLLGLLNSCWMDADMGNMFVADQTVNERFRQSEALNSEQGVPSLKTTSESYHVLAFGDSHVGGTENLRQTLSDAEQLNALVLMVGDLCTGRSEDYAVLAETIDEYPELFTFQVPGNHDLYFNGLTSFYEYFGSATYRFVVETPSAKDLFIALDTGSGTLGSEQLAWFKQVLEEDRENYRHCVVFTHNNLFRLRRTFSTNPPVEELRVLLDLFAEHMVDMVITGHDHKHQKEIFGHTTHIIMDALQDSNKSASYLKLTIKQNSIESEFVSDL